MHIHIVGIAGAMTTALAVELQRLGHTVTGSDQDQVYPPNGPILERHHILINQTTITPKIDLAIIGAAYQSFQRCREEFAAIQGLNIPYISATQYLADNVIHDESILVAGSFGKTSISALLSWILTQANFEPAYFFGGQAVNDFPSLRLNDSPWSVVEADESINGLDTQAKFLYYPVKYLVLTSAAWEHKDSYDTEKDNFNAYLKLVKKLPPNGLLVYNQNDPQATALAQYSPAPTIAYNSLLHFQTPLLGQFNQENLNAAYALCRQLKITDLLIKNAIASFRGIRRRLEICQVAQDIIFIDDFAQSASRIKQALEAVKNHYPSHPIKVFFEPHASFLQYKKSLSDFQSTFDAASEIVIAPLKYSRSVPKNSRTTAKDYLAEIGSKSHYLPDYPAITKHYQATLKKGDILIHFSSGGQQGLNTFSGLVNYFTNVNHSS
ncbi:Mur ligase family protein [Patescibacteria group bacterium]|nr:Mur ligase family protein [Patescibacteria group bacterium]